MKHFCPAEGSSSCITDCCVVYEVQIVAFSDVVVVVGFRLDDAYYLRSAADEFTYSYSCQNFQLVGNGSGMSYRGCWNFFVRFTCYCFADGCAGYVCLQRVLLHIIFSHSQTERGGCFPLAATTLVSLQDG
ncbi:unnamed protein product, partial [Ectocarpus sp. 8 AP-2014]